MDRCLKLHRWCPFHSNLNPQNPLPSLGILSYPFAKLAWNYVSLFMDCLNETENPLSLFAVSYQGRSNVCAVRAIQLNTIRYYLNLYHIYGSRFARQQFDMFLNIFPPDSEWLKPKGLNLIYSCC